MNPAFNHPKPPLRRVTPRLVVTIRETAKQLGVTELTIRRHIKSGKLHAIQVGGSWRIPTPNSVRISELPDECNLHQIANSLDVSDLTVRRWIKSGQFPATKRDRMWIVKRSDLADLLAAGTESGPSAPRQLGESG